MSILVTRGQAYGSTWSLPLLQKEEKVWQVSWNGSLLTSTFGKVGGKMRVIELAVDPKGGKTLVQQAHQVAFQRHEEKLRDGYQPKEENSAGPSNLEDGQESVSDEELSHGYGKLPMLCKTFVPKEQYDTIKKTKGKMPSNGMTITKYPVDVQQKMDGIRIVAKKLSGDEIQLRSRKNGIFCHMNHLRQSILHLLEFLPSNTEVDGEGYTEDLHFQQITSIIKNQKHRHPLEDKLRYYIFDLILEENLPYNKRYELLTTAFQRASEKYDLSNLRCVVTHEVRNEEELLQKHREFVQNGFEGTIIRCRSEMVRGEDISYYKCGKRSSGLLKYKDFMDDEFRVIDVQEGLGIHSGLATFVIENPNGTTEEARKINVNPRASHELRREWFLNKQKYIGKMYTVRYQGLTPDGNLRFPTGIAFRDYE